MREDKTAAHRSSQALDRPNVPATAVPKTRRTYADVAARVRDFSISLTAASRVGSLAKSKQSAARLPCCGDSLNQMRFAQRQTDCLKIALLWRQSDSNV
jgi:hypothetical protein